ncbi:GNAT family N-acetyltransferase [Luteipulveratus mongoliensis]|uniref:N-acetyltransferase domain-containing protein n=1 Tax=Luteipulveratus mongoliensis TaxID=571913 RepID=A0A0K1JKU2_9MICO|nr:GNAT family N-acetyltransferase [Luteipulveratus mongoliensis]AKU17344.1 hypothetical protein VV02_18295 [Luteipulveratus mongoliensis]
MTTDLPAADAAVRTARPADAAAVGEVQSRVWRTAYAGLLPREVLDTFEAEAFADIWSRSLAEPPTSQHRLLVATAGTDLVGLAAVGPTDVAGRGELLVLGVAPEHRRVGHGSRLLNAAVDTLRANDFREIEIWVAVGDETTRAFLESAGPQPDGAWRDREVAEDGTTAREVRLVASIVGT